ncbi:MAG TPA: hypothetical protein VGD87_13420 [Archangium sp.]
MLRLLALLCFLPAAAQAQAVVSAILDATGVSDAATRRAQRATENALKAVSSLDVGEGPSFKKGAPRKCGEDCARDLVNGLDASGAVLLELRSLDTKSDRVAIELQLWLDGAKVGAKRGEGSIEGFEAAVKPVLEALLPGWARKGYGGLKAELDPGSVLKVDGRLAAVSSGEVFAVPAGVHQVDVIFSEGHAVLQRLTVEEGSRVQVQAVSPVEAVSGKAPKSMSALRGVSYGAFVAGAATIAGGLIVGALGRGTAEGLSSCQGDKRDCATLEVVQARQAQAEAYANTGNVMLGIGSGLAATGVVLFVIDALTE